MDKEIKKEICFMKAEKEDKRIIKFILGENKRKNNLYFWFKRNYKKIISNSFLIFEKNYPLF